jgi:lysine 2,3-aminomutase
MLSDRRLEYIFQKLREIPHVEIIRIGSRITSHLPDRITQEFCDMVKKYHPVYMNTHFDHPDELTPASVAALARLADAGVPLGCQTVLLKGVNDDPEVMKRLMQKLMKARVRPYYIYMADQVAGGEHFRTTVEKGLEIVKALRGWTSGLAVPHFVIDAPGGGGKVPVVPNYLISYSDHKVVLRNYEGYITTYEEPETYQKHDQGSCAYCQHERPEPGQSGVLGLLEGERMWIEPKGFAEIHNRGNTEAHRLQDPSKWVPFGVGAIEGQASPALPVLESGEVAPTNGAKPEYGPGEEPRPREGEPTASAHGELL